MSTNIERLLILQERDTRIQRLNRDAADIPVRKKDLSDRLQHHTQQAEEARTKLKEHQAAVKRLQGDVDAVKEQINKYRNQQMSIKSNTEYKALEHEIEAAGKKISVFEDKELVLMEQGEVVKAELAQREADLKEEQTLLDEDLAALDERLQRTENEIADLQRDRTELAESIDPVWLKRYERILNHRGDRAFVPVENGCCGGCHMKLQPALIHDARKGLDMTACSFCGRLLYWAG